MGTRPLQYVSRGGSDHAKPVAAGDVERVSAVPLGDDRPRATVKHKVVARDEDLWWAHMQHGEGHAQHAQGQGVEQGLCVA